LGSGPQIGPCRYFNLFFFFNKFDGGHDVDGRLEMGSA
jgi:hypothetical protein